MHIMRVLVLVVKRQPVKQVAVVHKPLGKAIKYLDTIKNPDPKSVPPATRVVQILGFYI